MNTLQQCATEYFEKHTGVTLAALLAPVDLAFPTGKSIRGSNAYNAIEKARRQDDDSLPLGGWEYDLKRADWPRVTTLAIEALQTQSKDMQLVAWLLESQLNQRCFSAIAPCMVLMQSLLETYWDNLYPQIEDNDLEYRTNVISWINEKLLPVLRLSPVTSTGKKCEYSWSDWEHAHRNEQIRNSAANNEDKAAEGIALGEFSQAVSATPVAYYLSLQQTLNTALHSIETLTQLLDDKFGTDAPSLGNMQELLQQVLSLADAELHKRGVRAPQEIVAEANSEVAAPATGTEAASARPAVAAGGPIHDRADAYARLMETADFLMHLEPHSPVPYLVRRAAEWGQLNTVELYQELFLRLNGQLNIFEMLGLPFQQEAEHSN